MGIYDDKVEQIDLKGQLKPFNINQLNRVMHILCQGRLGFDTSYIPTDEIPEESQMGQSLNRMEYPSTPKQFNLFQEYKNVEHDSNMLTADQRMRVYEDRSKVTAEMAEVFYIFSRIQTMIHSNQAREDDALFAGIEVYDGEDPSRFEGWLDAMEQVCNMTDRNL